MSAKVYNSEIKSTSPGIREINFDWPNYITPSSCVQLIYYRSTMNIKYTNKTILVTQWHSKFFTLTFSAYI